VSPAVQALLGLTAFCVVAVLMAGAVDRFGTAWTSALVFGLLVVALVLEATTHESSVALAAGLIVLVSFALVWVLEVGDWRGKRD
jgi:TRAP-type uncharacterized transport system fused permease subunit